MYIKTTKMSAAEEKFEKFRYELLIQKEDEPYSELGYILLYRGCNSDAQYEGIINESTAGGMKKSQEVSNKNVEELKCKYGDQKYSRPSTEQAKRYVAGNFGAEAVPAQIPGMLHKDALKFCGDIVEYSWDKKTAQSFGLRGGLVCVKVHISHLKWGSEAECGMVMYSDVKVEVHLSECLKREKLSKSLGISS
ncbi:MAG: hypothetical protein RMX96_24635 [Nostoc sp. ChiSLP02]|nr:hypothetical protein [Nostoc sp. DedSLP05]MDZ8103223.1 hypothetical protein [Nostoc sp. DedSLP01]MDZ8188026.1 hypothetical protein [Nostoc sp. ChiSLP02]